MIKSTVEDMKRVAHMKVLTTVNSLIVIELPTDLPIVIFLKQMILIARVHDRKGTLYKGGT